MKIELRETKDKGQVPIFMFWQMHKLYGPILSFFNAKCENAQNLKYQFFDFCNLFVSLEGHDARNFFFIWVEMDRISLMMMAK